MSDNRFANDERAILAAKWFPKQWAKIAFAEGKTKARLNLKVRAVVQEKLQALHAEGKRCGTCTSYGPSRIAGKFCCAWDSGGWDGDLIVGADSLCLKWTPIL